MKLGLYSITYLGLWYRGKELTLPEMIGRAREYGYDGIEIDGKRPHGNPLDWPTARCRELRAIADGEGIDIYAVAANNDFSNPVPEVREAQICFVRELIRMAADLGAPTLRVFLAWWGVTRHPQLATYDIAEGYWPIVHEKFPTEEIWGWCREALVECARYAGDAGVTLALQNHKPLIDDHHDLLRMIREVGSPHLKACLDAPLLPDRSTAGIREAAHAVGPLQVLTHFGGEFERLPDGSIRGFERNDGVVGEDTNRYYADFARAMTEVGYDGYIGYELCHQLPVVNGRDGRHRVRRRAGPPRRRVHAGDHRRGSRRRGRARRAEEAHTMALRRTLALTLVLAIAGTAAGQEKKRRLLVVGQAKGYQHESISTAMVTLYNLGRGPGQWDTVFRTDCTAITKKPLKYGAKNLDDFDAVAFFTDGDLDMDDSQKADLLAFVRDDGKGFLGIHSAAITFTRWPDYGDDARRLFRRPPLGRVRRPPRGRRPRLPRPGPPPPRVHPERRDLPDQGLLARPGPRPAPPRRRPGRPDPQGRPPHGRRLRRRLGPRVRQGARRLQRAGARPRRLGAAGDAVDVAGAGPLVDGPRPRGRHPSACAGQVSPRSSYTTRPVRAPNRSSETHPRVAGGAVGTGRMGRP